MQFVIEACYHCTQCQAGQVLLIATTNRVMRTAIYIFKQIPHLVDRSCVDDNVELLLGDAHVKFRPFEIKKLFAVAFIVPQRTSQAQCKSKQASEPQEKEEEEEEVLDCTGI